MPRRSITDEEIGLIKAMLRRGMRNRDIQFYFNRQDRPVNSGRITGIRSGDYGPVTNLYNARHAWLDHTHRALDEAVAEAYGWGDDWRVGVLIDDEILARLFRLNQALA